MVNPIAFPPFAGDGPVTRADMRQLVQALEVRLNNIEIAIDNLETYEIRLREVERRLDELTT